ncbi:MAG: type VI secretion system baseplate subunit TssK [Planctomycetes bacterium]|nr:type VI secretion system baseplate subunit TssK [Planctomycetota bacterium]
MIDTHVHAQKVLWHEGMFLTPQHFQQWDRHHGRTILQHARAIGPRAYGFASLAIDARALAGGSFSLISAEGIMPDGMAFDLGNGDDIPQSRPIELAPGRDRIAVFLAAPIERIGGAIVSDSGHVDGQPTRYRRRTATVRDGNPGGGAREIALAAKHLRLVIEGESLADHAWLKLAEVQRSTSGGLIVGDSFAPACLGIGVSPSLRACVRRMLEVLIARSAEMAARRRERAEGTVEFSVSEVANFVMLHTVNGHIPGLAHAHAMGDVHPETVFLQLAALAGQLCTFATSRAAKDVPGYTHDDPLGCFTRLEDALRSLVDAIVPTRYVPIPLVRSRDHVHAATLPEHTLQAARMYLSVHSSFPAEKVLREVPLKAKVASAGRLDLLIAQALRGVRLTYLAIPPAEIPVQPGRCYFELGREGDEWISARDARSLAIYLPNEFSDASMELLAVTE